MGIKVKGNSKEIIRIVDGPDSSAQLLTALEKGVYDPNSTIELQLQRQHLNGDGEPVDIGSSADGYIEFAAVGLNQLDINGTVFQLFGYATRGKLPGNNSLEFTSGGSTPALDDVGLAKGTFVNIILDIGATDGIIVMYDNGSAEVMLNISTDNPNLTPRRPVRPYHCRRTD